MLFKSAEFFFLLATLHTQKKVKEIAYILTSYQALLKAQLFFFYYLYSEKTIKRKDKITEMKFLFVFLFM